MTAEDIELSLKNPNVITCPICNGTGGEPWPPGFIPLQGSEIFTKCDYCRGETFLDWKNLTFGTIGSRITITSKKDWILLHALTRNHYVLSTAVRGLQSIYLNGYTHKEIKRFCTKYGIPCSHKLDEYQPVGTEPFKICLIIGTSEACDSFKESTRFTVRPPTAWCRNCHRSKEDHK